LKSHDPNGKILSWKPFRNTAGTLFGFLDAELPSGIIINGMPVLGPKGKPVWNSYIEFRDREVRTKFQDTVLEMLRRQHPDAFDDAGA
jgi:hypothetical protein